MKPSAVSFVTNIWDLFISFTICWPEFTAIENVAMPLLMRKAVPIAARVNSLLNYWKSGVGHRLTHRPGELSGGERQRWRLLERW